MSVFYNSEKLPLFRNAVITIGTFDGVHLGHQKILRTITDTAKNIGGESVVITFDPHPRRLISPDKELKILTPLENKIELISSQGVDHIVVVPFTLEFSTLSAEQYISDFLIEKFHPNTIVIGYDHHFGSDRTGNIQLLKSVQQQYNYQLIEIPEQLVDEAGISSTKIRTALQNGNVQDAATMMGRSYSLKGKVIKGKQLGRTIGYPTANIDAADNDQLLPSVGIYCVKVVHESKEFGGMLSIGYNPTVTDEHTIKIEVNIFDFDKNIYDDLLEIVFINYMRSEEKFDSLEALKSQLAKDELMARKMLF